MKKYLALLIIIMIIGCNAEDGSSSNVDDTRNNILTGTWIYTYTITSQFSDSFELNAAGGIMTGYFTNSYFGDFLTLYGDYDEETMGFLSSDWEVDRKYNFEATYDNNSMTGTLIISTISGDVIQSLEITAVKQ